MKLVLIDTSGIQKYIFGSNRLRENVGASYLVASATREWVFDSLPKTNNLKFDSSVKTWTFRCDQHMESNEELQAEVVYSGGGNAVVLFRDGEKAGHFVRTYTKRILKDAPGLQALVAVHDFDWERNPSGLHDAVGEGLQELNRLKRKHAPLQPLLGLGVTRSCQSTGMPAVGGEKLGGRRDSRIYDVSREVQIKHNSRGAANSRLSQLIPPRDGFVYPSELDDLGRSVGEFSYIAVVHIDGNGLGRRIIYVGKDATNREYISRIRSFSESLNVAGIEAMKATVGFLTDCIDNRGGLIFDPDFPGCRGREVLLNFAEQGSWTLPIRPIIFGGDDVTFVCDARIAIPLTLQYIEHFTSQTKQLPDHEGAAGCCAGIAIVKSHYPFARAYQLSEQLCGSAKKLVRSTGILTESAIDWHFANAGLAGDLDEIREREFKVASGRLNLRPAFVSSNQTGLSSWATLQRGIDAFRGRDWAGRRNKIKALRDVLRDGPAKTELFCQKFGLRLPDLALENEQHRQTGWISNVNQPDSRCAYFDMIELADFLIPLRPLELPVQAAQPDGVAP